MFDSLLGMAKSMLGDNADAATPEALESAVASHVGDLPVGDLVSHFIGMVPNLPDDARSQLANTVMGALGQNGSSASDVADAGVPVDDAQNGDHAALGALLEHAAQNPDGLRDAAVQYIQNNPQLIQQYAPDLLKGVLSKFGV